MDEETLLIEIFETRQEELTEERKEWLIEHCELCGITIKEYRELQLRALAARRKDNPNYPGKKIYPQK